MSKPNMGSPVKPEAAKTELSIELIPKSGSYLNGVFVERKYDRVADWIETLTLAQLDRLEALLNAEGAILKRLLADGQTILNVMDDCNILGTEGAFT